MPDRGPILSHYEVRPLLAARAQGAAATTGSADLGKSTVPALRGLASRAPYFHDGTAKDLNGVVNFYNKRFNIGLSAKDKADLVNFLAAL